jgi:cytochrome P450
MILLMIAGIDTTWSAIGASLWHLARHPAEVRGPRAFPSPSSRTPSSTPVPYSYCVVAALMS